MKTASVWEEKNVLYTDLWLRSRYPTCKMGINYIGVSVNVAIKRSDSGSTKIQHSNKATGGKNTPKHSIRAKGNGGTFKLKQKT